MNENVKWGAAAVAVVGLSIGAVVYVSQRKPAPPPTTAPIVAAPAPVAPADESAIQHPIPAADTDVALPSLDDSDAPAQKVLEDLIGKDPVAKFVVPKDLVRHIVVTIDNLPEQKVAERIRPLSPVTGRFTVTGTEEAPLL